MRRISRTFARLGLAAVWLGLLFPVAVMADDCARDWRRAEDCLRTPGFAQGIAAAVATVVTVLVNGVPIASTVFPPKKGEAEEQGEDTRYTLDARSDEGRTELFVDGSDILWVFGKVDCNKPDIDTGPLTGSVSFAVHGPNADWVQIGTPEYRDGYRAVPLRAWAPAPEATLLPGGPTVVVSATIEGRRFNGPIDIHLQHFQLEVTPMA